MSSLFFKLALELEVNVNSNVLLFTASFLEPKLVLHWPHSEMTPSQVLSLFRILQRFNLRLKSLSCIIRCPFSPCLPAEAAVPAGTNATCFVLFWGGGGWSSKSNSWLNTLHAVPKFGPKSYLHFVDSLKQNRTEKIPIFYFSQLQTQH